jgi:hypothetical protein
LLNLFYDEPDPDRWFCGDRYPRRILRSLLRRRRTGSQKQLFLSLSDGLRKLGVAYRVNDYANARAHPEELACIVGKPFLLDRMRWDNPILFGAAVFSHPLDDPQLLQRLPVRRILVPGEWTRQMFAPYYGDAVCAWPAGIDTDYWSPRADIDRDLDVLVYEKLLWPHLDDKHKILRQLNEIFARRGWKHAIVHYGGYQRPELRRLAQRSKLMVFLSRHETQGFAYQQVLSCNVPVLAYDPGGVWPDPSYYPHRVKFSPVTSVPYWDERCGERFSDWERFEDRLETTCRLHRDYSPRDFILQNLTLEISTRKYLDHVQEVLAPAATVRNSLEPRAGHCSCGDYG